MPQQGLWCKQHKRLAEASNHLATQDMENLRRGRGLNDLHIVLSAKLQESLDARR